MKRKISSDLTRGVKFMEPLFVFAGMGYMIFIDINFYDCRYISRLTEDISSWTFLVITIMICHHVCRCVFIKDVSVDDAFLHVSNCRGKEIRIPLSDVAFVRQTCPMRLSPELVMVMLTSPSEFGRKIFFIPRSESHSILDPHPIVDELNRLISSYKQKIGV